MSQKRRVSALAYVLTAVGILGIVISLVIEQSDYDPVAFGIATISILIAIAGLALAFKVPAGIDQPKEGAP
ncbi:MAG: hypothetical protein ABSA50_01720 [Candidatus Bathyarchaeia archaeon]